MPWKMDGDKYVLQDGHLVAIVKDTDGKEREYTIDPDQVLGKISALTKESETRRKALEEIDSKYKPWAELKIDDKPADPQTVTEALQALKNVKDKKLLDAGEVQKIRDDAVKDFKQQVTDRDAQIASLSASLVKTKLGYAFAGSKFLREKTYLPDDMALEYFGKHFKIEGDRIIGYNGEDKIPSSTKPGELAEFDEALEFHATKHPLKERFMKNEAGGGSGASPSSSRDNGKPDYSKLPPTDRLAAHWGEKPA